MGLGVIIGYDELHWVSKMWDGTNICTCNDEAAGQLLVGIIASTVRTRMPADLSHGHTVQNTPKFPELSVGSLGCYSSGWKWLGIARNDSVKDLKLREDNWFS